MQAFWKLSLRRSFVLLILIALTACSASVETERSNTFARNAIDYSELTFTPWDVEAASAGLAARDKKPYTIMVYMNGSDLESEDGSATYDLIEMLESGVSQENLNLIVFTGGTLRWQNDLIPANDCMLWEIADGEIFSLASAGLLNMGDPGTLSGFIDFGMKNFPAENFGLIMWDHGGGSIAGYGHDEKFGNSTLTLADMEYAFKKSGLAKQKLEFLGFDSCLMSTVEMAVVASDFAKYLIASEDLSPGDGWDYSFLKILNNEPLISADKLGIAIADSFMEFYGDNAEDILNISVIDLSKANDVMQAMGQLMSLCNESLINDRQSSFRALARRRSGTRTFGTGSPRDNESDMVDIGDMAHSLSDMYPQEAANILSALDKAVIYNRNNAGVYLSGLSAYYIYGGRNIGRESLDVYANLNMDSEYTSYLQRFFSMLSGGTYRSRSNTQPDEILSTELTAWRELESGYFMMTGINPPENIDLWPFIGGMPVCLYKINSFGANTLYAAPAKLNDRRCDLVVLINEKHPDGKILGVRNEDGFVVQKGYDKLNNGDKLEFYYPVRHFETSESYWQQSEAFTITDALQLEWHQNKDVYYSLRMIDIRNNEYYTTPEKYPEINKTAASQGYTQTGMKMHIPA